MVIQTTEESVNGTMFWDRCLIKAYTLANGFYGKDGKVATMPDVVVAKAITDERSLLWTNYVTTTSGEFYGKSKGGIPIIVVAHGIDAILQDEEIMKRSTKNLRENPMIQLTPEEFQRLKNEFYGPTEVIPHSTIVKMREHPASVLSYDQAMAEDPLLFARLGPKAADFLTRHRQITLRESGNSLIVTNDHKYSHNPRENAGGLITISQLNDCRRGSGKSSISTDIDVSDLTHAARFIAMSGKGYLGAVNNRLESILRDLEANWELLTTPTEGSQGKELYVLQTRGAKNFTEYREDDDIMDSGVPQFPVRCLKRVGEPTTFTTQILGYHGFFKYHQADVRKICPEGANAYTVGEPTVIYEGGNPVKHAVSIRFYSADVDTSRRILREEEIKGNIGLVQKLLRS